MNATRRPRGTRAPAVRRLVEVFRGRLLGARTHRFLRQRRPRPRRLADGAARGPGTPGTAATGPASAGADDVTAYTRRLWVTRPRPGVDRMGSAWLIRRFVDAGARFGFAVDRDSLPATGRDPVRHVRRRVQPPGRRLHVRDAVQPSSASGSGSGPHRRDRPRPRPEGRPLRRGRSDDGRRPSSKDSSWRRPTTTRCSSEASRCSSRCTAPSRSRGARPALDRWRRLALVPRRPRARDATAARRRSR